MIDCNQEDKCRVCGGDGSACETTSNVIKDQDMTMGYNDLAMIPPGATNIRIAEVQFFSSSIKWIGHSLKSCDFRWRLPTTTWPWGTRPATITWTATGGSTTHSSSRQRVSCSLWQHSIHPSIHPSIHLFHPRNNIPLREKVQELEGTGSPHPLCTREHSCSGTNNGGSFHCGQHRFHLNRDQQRFRVHNDKLLGVVPRRKSWRRVWIFPEERCYERNTIRFHL